MSRALFLPAGFVARYGGRWIEYPLYGTVPAANGSSPGTLNLAQTVDSGFHFFSEILSTQFTTIESISGTDTDVGFCDLTAQFFAGNQQTNLTSDWLNLSLIGAPGRQLTAGIAGNPSGFLQIEGYPWPVLYASTGQIIANLRNASNTQNNVFFSWGGWLFPTSNLPSLEAFWTALAQWESPQAFMKALKSALASDGSMGLPGR